MMIHDADNEWYICSKYHLIIYIKYQCLSRKALSMPAFPALKASLLSLLVIYFLRMSSIQAVMSAPSNRFILPSGRRSAKSRGMFSFTPSGSSMAKESPLIISNFWKHFKLTYEITAGCSSCKQRVRAMSLNLLAPLHNSLTCYSASNVTRSPHAVVPA
jgi:hypothetical protein